MHPFLRVISMHMKAGAGGLVYGHSLPIEASRTVRVEKKGFLF